MQDDTLEGLDTWLDHAAQDTIVEDGLDTVQEAALPPADDPDPTALTLIADAAADA